LPQFTHEFAILTQWAELGPGLTLSHNLFILALWPKSPVAYLLTRAPWARSRCRIGEPDQAGGGWQLRKGRESPQSHGIGALSAYCVPARAMGWARLPQTEALFFKGLRRAAFTNRTKPGGPGASQAGVGEKQGAGSEGGVQIPPGSPASKGLCVAPRLPAAGSALPRLRQAREAPRPLWGQTQIVPGPAARPVAWGTKLNRLTSPSRCAATGTDSPFPPWR
jgi:hypothetical protein